MNELPGTTRRLRSDRKIGPLRRTQDATTLEVSWSILPTDDPGQAENQGLQRACRLFTFMENHLRIVLKDQKGRTKALAPFRFNEVQLELAVYVANQWAAGRPIRAVIVKARQEGVSTFFQGYNFSVALNLPGFRSAVVAHDEDGAGRIFAISRVFERNLPESLRRTLNHKQQSMLEWDHAGTPSGIWVGSAKTADGLGMGGTLQAVHFSEVANFSDKGNDADGGIVSILGSLAETHACSAVVYESTAKGCDPIFYAKCEEARLDPSSEYRLFFFPWWMDAGYRLPWSEWRDLLTSAGKPDPGERFVPTEEEEMLRRRLASQEVPRGAETWCRRTDLTDDQLVWRRWAIVNKYQGKLDQFQRFCPAFYEEAFTATTSCLFDNDTIKHYERLAAERPPIATGWATYSKGAASFLTTPAGMVRVWRRPTPGHLYVLGVDPGGSRLQSDFSAAVVIDKATLEAVATLHGHLEWDDLVTKIHFLGLYYNEALAVVERYTRGAHIVDQLVKNEYPNVYYYLDETATRGTISRPGWPTNVRTRPMLVLTLDAATRGRGFRCYDPQMAKEMPHFVLDEQKNTYRAMGRNHDDFLLAAAIALQQCEGVLPPPALEPAEPAQDDTSPVRRFLLQLEASRTPGVLFV